MGLYRTDNPGRAGGDVAKYDGWPIVNILREFRELGLDDELNRIRFRRALLVSYEFTAIAKGARVNV